MLTTLGTALLRLNSASLSDFSFHFLSVLIGVVLPTKAMSGGIMNLALIATYQQLLGEAEGGGGGEGPAQELWAEFRRELLAMAISGAVFWVLLALLQSRRVAWAWHKFTNNITVSIALKHLPIVNVWL